MSAPRTSHLVIASIVAVAGTAVHDQYELGGPSVQNTLPFAAITAALVAGWQLAPAARPLTGRALHVTALVLLAGGALASVLPLPIWPFHPEQTAGHYAVHAVWALGLLPLLVATRRRDASDTNRAHTNRPLRCEPAALAAPERWQSGRMRTSKTVWDLARRLVHPRLTAEPRVRRPRRRSRLAPPRASVE